MTVKYETPKEGVALITLNRPDKLNSFNRELRADLTQALAKASADDAVRAVVVTGEGRAFCAGADVSAVDEMANGIDFNKTAGKLASEKGGKLSMKEIMEIHGH